METQSNVFIPKYKLTTYLGPLASFVGFAFLLLIALSELPFKHDWVYIFLLVSFCIAALYDASKIVRAIEFRESEMIVRYYIRMKKIIYYREIKRIAIGVSINAKNGRIYMNEMNNKAELQTKVADILRSRKILDINLEEESRKSISAKKR